MVRTIDDVRCFSPTMDDPSRPIAASRRAKRSPVLPLLPSPPTSSLRTTRLRVATCALLVLALPRGGAAFSTTPPTNAASRRSFVLQTTTTTTRTRPGVAVSERRPSAWKRRRRRRGTISVRLAKNDDDDDEAKNDNEEHKNDDVDNDKDVDVSFLLRDDDDAGTSDSDDSDGSSSSSAASVWSRIDPFRAGRRLRDSLDSLSTLPGLKPPSTKSSSSSSSASPSSSGDADDRFVYVSDRLLERSDGLLSDSPLSDSPLLEDSAPEVLVVGATGGVGRLVVRRLLRDPGRYRVRVLVRDLYSSTIDLLGGAGITYCTGDLDDAESLEYAVTDVDKIVFCASDRGLSDDDDDDDEAAGRVDDDGLRNLLRAYQNVRFADYGTSQTPKRSLFKFRSRPDDFRLFRLDDGEEDETEAAVEQEREREREREDAGGVGDDVVRPRNTVRSRCAWIRNDFGHGVFVGRLPPDGEAAVVSNRLSGRRDENDENDDDSNGDDVDRGVDLGGDGGFAGFVLRLCGDGNDYQAFVRTSDGEYVQDFGTSRKYVVDGGATTTGDDVVDHDDHHHQTNQSRNRFTSVRLPFSGFVRRSDGILFDGADLRRIGVRFLAGSRRRPTTTTPLGRRSPPLRPFYLALAHVKVYRAVPEPEFVYLSDARIPRDVRRRTVRHDVRRIATTERDFWQTVLVDGSENGNDEHERRPRATSSSSYRQRRRRRWSDEETYYKYMGEEALRNSGLSYAIVRVSGYNESPSGDSENVRLQQTERGVAAVSRADVAEVCVSCLLDPNACNTSFYVTSDEADRRRRRRRPGEGLAEKLARLTQDG